MWLRNPNYLITKCLESFRIISDVVLIGRIFCPGEEVFFFVYGRLAVRETTVTAIARSEVAFDFCLEWTFVLLV